MTNKTLFLTSRHTVPDLYVYLHNISEHTDTNYKHCFNLDAFDDTVYNVYCGEEFVNSFIKMNNISTDEIYENANNRTLYTSESNIKLKVIHELLSRKNSTDLFESCVRIISNKNEFNAKTNLVYFNKNYHQTITNKRNSEKMLQNIYNATLKMLPLCNSTMNQFRMREYALDKVNYLKSYVEYFSNKQ